MIEFIESIEISFTGGWAIFILCAVFYGISAFIKDLIDSL